MTHAYVAPEDLLALVLATPLERWRAAAPPGAAELTARLAAAGAPGARAYHRGPVRTRTVSPPPGFAEADSVHPCARAIDATSDSPRPAPSPG